MKKDYREFPDAPAGLVGWPWHAEDIEASPVMAPDSATPLISIVVPSFNQGCFLEKTLRSILLQNYPKLELFVVDGGSSDSSLSVIEKYEDWITRWVSEEDRGQSHALNKGFEWANGELLGWLNSDDILCPNSLQRIADTWSQLNPEDFGAVVGLGDIVSEDGQVYFSPDLPEIDFDALMNWNQGVNFMQPSCFFSSIAWKQCGPLDENLHYCMDLDLWVRIARKFKFKTVREMLSHSLAHDLAKTRKDAERSLVEVALLVNRYGREDIARRSLYLLADELSLCRKITDQVSQELSELKASRWYRSYDFLRSTIRGLTGQKN